MLDAEYRIVSKFIHIFLDKIIYLVLITDVGFKSKYYAEKKY